MGPRLTANCNTGCASSAHTDSTRSTASCFANICSCKSNQANHNHLAASSCLLLCETRFYFRTAAGSISNCLSNRHFCLQCHSEIAFGLFYLYTALSVLVRKLFPVLSIQFFYLIRFLLSIQLLITCSTNVLVEHLRLTSFKKWHFHLSIIILSRDFLRISDNYFSLKTFQFS